GLMSFSKLNGSSAVGVDMGRAPLLVFSRRTRERAARSLKTAGVGFEPTGRLHALRFSRPARSTTPAPRPSEQPRPTRGAYLSHSCRCRASTPMRNRRRGTWGNHWFRQATTTPAPRLGYISLGGLTLQ